MARAWELPIKKHMCALKVFLSPRVVSRVSIYPGPGLTCCVALGLASKCLSPPRVWRAIVVAPTLQTPSDAGVDRVCCLNSTFEHSGSALLPCQLLLPILVEKASYSKDTLNLERPRHTSDLIPASMLLPLPLSHTYCPHQHPPHLTGVCSGPCTSTQDEADAGFTRGCPKSRHVGPHCPGDCTHQGKAKCSDWIPRASQGSTRSPASSNSFLFPHYQ